MLAVQDWSQGGMVGRTSISGRAAWLVTGIRDSVLVAVVRNRCKGDVLGTRACRRGRFVAGRHAGEGLVLVKNP